MRDDDLVEASRQLGGDVRVVVLEGDWGLGPFSPEAVAWLQAADLVTVAALSGQVRATGLALACDLRIAAEGTTIDLAAPPDGVGALVEAVGAARATAWCLTGRSVEAQTALDAGLLLKVVPEDRLEEAVNRLVQDLLGQDRFATTERKALLQGAGRRTAGEQWKAEAEARARIVLEE